MKVQCPHCAEVIPVDDADVRAYLNKQAGKKPRPGSKGNKRAAKKKLTDE